MSAATIHTWHTPDIIMSVEKQVPVAALCGFEKTHTKESVDESLNPDRDYCGPCREALHREQENEIVVVRPPVGWDALRASWPGPRFTYTVNAARSWELER